MSVQISHLHSRVQEKRETDGCHGMLGNVPQVVRAKGVIREQHPLVRSRARDDENMAPQVIGLVKGRQ
jgi:hypothetical protein